MDSTLLYCLLFGIVLVLFFVVARVALRWVFKLAVVVLLLLMVIGGVTWLWFDYSAQQSPPKSRPTSVGRASTDRQ